MTSGAEPAAWPDFPALPPPVDHRRRRDRLRAGLAERELEALYVTDLRNVRWLTGFRGTNGRVLVRCDGELDVLFTDSRYTTQAHAEAPGLDLVTLRSGVVDRIVRRLSRAGLATVGFEADHLSWEAGESLRGKAREEGIDARPASGHVEALRAVKDEHELAAIRAACAITVATFEHVLGSLRPGANERAVAVALDRCMVDLGAESPAFDTIVASGPNSAIPHHRPTTRELRPGDLLKLDFGARYGGYHADMSRTVALGDPVRNSEPSTTSSAARRLRGWRQPWRVSRWVKSTGPAGNLSRPQAGASSSYIRRVTVWAGHTRVANPRGGGPC